MAKVARGDEQKFDCATWLHKAQELPKEQFEREVQRHLTGQETEPWEALCFTVYQSQLAVIEQALETASLMIGGQQARGYCLVMICADFLASTLNRFSWRSVELTRCSRPHNGRISCCAYRRHLCGNVYGGRIPVIIGDRPRG